MKIKYYITLTFVPLALLFTGCDTNTQHHTTQVQKKEAAYVDFQRWSEGRVCNKVLSGSVCLRVTIPNGGRSLLKMDLTASS